MDTGHEPVYRRREVVGGAVAVAAAATVGIPGLRALLTGGGDAAQAGGGSGYGALRAPDANGVRLPEGFSSRRVAKAGDEVAGSGYRWHEWPDGAATFPRDDGGWVLVSNSETREGGVGAIRFAADGAAVDAYRILDGTSFNCSGGPTPWGTWLSCEEFEEGRVWECDPAGRKKAVVHPAMGVFKHEAAAVDPIHRHVYLTEDLPDGAFYRYTPSQWPDLGEGLLELAVVKRSGAVEWRRVPDPLARRTPTRHQVRGSTRFERAEGIWFHEGVIYVATTYDTCIRTYDTRTGRMRVVYNGLATRNAPLLRVDQMTASPAGEVFICEDISLREIPMGVLGKDGRMTRFLSVTGKEHENSELTGVAFTPDAKRMYFSSQRAYEQGAVYEVTGPFHT